jgi:Tol biopolymer transport system component
LKAEADSGITVSAVRPAVTRQKGLSRVALAGATVVVIAGVGYGLYKAAGGQSAPAAGSIFEADRFTRLTSEGNAFLAAISPDGRYVAHVKSTGPMPSLWLRQTTTTSDVQIVPAGEVRYDGVTFSPDGDYVYYNTYTISGGVATLYRVPVLGGTPHSVLEDVDSRISFSPDKRQLTFTRGSPSRSTAHVIVANADGTGMRELASMPSPDLFINSGPAWSPDGKTIIAPVTSSRDGPHNLVAAVDVATGKTTVVNGRWAFVGDLVWAPDGQSFVMSAADFGGGGPQIWQVEFPSGEARRITNDLNNYVGATLAADGRSLTTVQTENVSNLWVAPAAEPAGGTRITSGRGAREGLSGLAWTPDGRVVYGAVTSGRPQIWIANADGSNARQLTTADAASVQPTVTSDGRYIVFQRFTRTGVHIWRMGLDGSDSKQLTTGGSEQGPQAGDGFVYYNTFASGSPRVYRIPIDGGQPVLLGDYYFRVADISPDRRRLLGLTWDQQERRSVPAVLSVEGGTPEKIPQAATPFGARWMADGKSLSYWAPQKDELILFKVGLADKTVTRLAKMPDNLFAIAWSPDGKHVAAARGQNLNDVVLITAKASTPRAGQ